MATSILTSAASTRIADGRLWIATLGDGLIRFDTATGRTKRYLPDALDLGEHQLKLDWASRG